MAWIESFKVQGLAGRKEPVIHTLDRHLNIFWGLNGAGKTTLFHILHAALEGDASIIEDLPFESAEVVFKDRISKGRILKVTRTFTRALKEVSEVHQSDIFTSTGSLAFDSYFRSDHEPPPAIDENLAIDDGYLDYDSYQQSGRWVSTYSVDDHGFFVDLFGHTFSHSYLPISRVTDADRLAPHFPEDRSRVSNEAFGEQIREVWRDYSLKSSTAIRDIQQQGLAKVLSILFGGDPSAKTDQTDVGDVAPDLAYSLIETFLVEQDIQLQMDKAAFIQRFETSTEHRQVVAEIQTVRRLVDLKLGPQKEFQRIINLMFRGNKQLILDISNRSPLLGMHLIRIDIGESPIPLYSLSSGEKQLLRLLLQVLGAEDSAVIVDEPELSLHVNWQQQLVTSMQTINSDCQLLLASHSPEIMAGVSDDYIIEL
ncbi:MAG: AAA family ATPase [Dermabacter sp.]|nr:AAA family ATPase [Dermabacter sp.]